MSKGFSLVELMVVIAIIGILAALLFPVFATAKRAARTAVCVSNTRQIGGAILIYAGDYDDRMPYGPGPIAKKLSLEGAQLGDDPFTDLMKTLPDLKYLVTPYASSNGVWMCPLDQISPVIAEGRAGTWFQETGSSYGYDEFDALSGISFDQVPNPADRLLLRDEEGFHGPGDQGSPTVSMFNCLLFDGHVKTSTFAQKLSYQSDTLWF